MNQNQWSRYLSNALFVLAALCGLAALWMIIFQQNGPGLTAQSPEVELGEVSPGDTLPVQVALRNHSRQPIRIVGANEG